MKLIVGLGNPGKKYQDTRHNIGFRVIDRLAQQNEIKVSQLLCDALVHEYFVNGEKCFLAKPQTWMNRSGASVQRLIQELNGSSEDLVVVYDDLDLPFGRIRIRPSGGAGGHRGLLSIIESLGGAPFCRVRFGVGRPPQDMEAENYVLAPFSTDESSELGEKIDRVAAAVTSIVRDGIKRAMEQFNRAL